MSPSSQDLEASADDRLLHRLLFFTDAVFAIVLTLMALELKAPEGKTTVEIAVGLVRMGWTFVAFAGSFALVGVFWLAHMSSMRRLAHFDWPVAVLNLALLFSVCLMPFSTSLIAHGLFVGLPWEIYCWNLILTSTTLVVLNLMLGRNEGRLLGGVNHREQVYRAMRAAVPGLAFVVSLVLSRFGRPDLATLAPLLIPISYILLRTHVRHRVLKA
jgi:uncharacterized membrane protein